MENHLFELIKIFIQFGMQLPTNTFFKSGMLRAPTGIFQLLKLMGKQFFTLMPSSYNNLKHGESMSMNFTIKEVIPNRKFSYYWDSNQMLFSIELSSEANGTRVEFNQEGFNYSLENLKAYLENRELFYS